ncbi:Peptidoglycan-binding lysin domain protein [Cellulomonas flavigena DSM 20109]|uniref:Peptidoglycan-binding lysin domain protein n=1 Tax=Cellulomonas flavigena (strain ATCC 482 / DSM 20109 / BCRC 11376 / JCM 18109 / NBRC 3775 / NCIMB 8073 / NRS 134) TaxID=446466 RepID=D5UGQ9_CELFN|nr:LysM peptidoglycan-binding domain-containing protein [Cellulomonas flavigena]ADG75157.1 Peptidoglycan-binding lysin domain protein [Cellulomonas flavigena DSM 20109]
MGGAPTGLDAGAATTAGGSEGSLKKALLELHEPSLDGSLHKPGALIGTIAFQFNPKELTVSKAATWTRPTTRGSTKASPPQYQGPKPSSMTLEMFLDASVVLATGGAQGDGVVPTVEKLLRCCVPTDSSHGKKKDSPPWVQLKWGGVTGFVGYVEKVDAKYTLFTPAGLPVRAVCTVTLQELAGEPPGTNPTSGTPTPHREHVVVHGDSLAGIAYAEYGDASLWRAVAEVNRVDDPARLRPGRRLLLPTADEVARPTSRSGLPGAAVPALPAAPAPAREVARGAR